MIQLAEELICMSSLHNDRPRNEAEFEIFYNQYYTSAYRYTVKKIQNFHDAEDLVCDVFMYCYDHFYDYDANKASLGTWLYLILNSRIKNYYRGKKQTISIDFMEDDIDRNASYIDQALELETLRQNLAEAIQTLSESQRKIVILRYFQGLDTADTAKKVGISVGNTRTQLSRALVKIRNYLEANGYEKG